MSNGFKKLKETTISIIDDNTGYKKKIISKLFQLPNGLIETFFIDQDKDSVCVFPVTQDGRVILVKQFRAGPEKVQLELPGGGLEPSEKPLKAAMRELKEECALTGDFYHLASIPYSPYSNGIRHCFLAINCQKNGNINLDPNEFLKTEEYSVDEVKNMIKNGSIRNSDVIYMGFDCIADKKLL